MSFKRKILSIDGGGIRGIIPALILKKIEERTRKPIAELFDLVAGTSTGGILALGLTIPHPEDPTKPKFAASELVDLYKERGKQIFFEPTLERLTQLDDMIRPKYSSIGREKVLTEYLGDTLVEDSLKEVLITSYDIQNRFPVFFTSEKDKEETEGREFRKICSGISMVEAAMATSAAPTYFEPYTVQTQHQTPTSGGKYALVDGGVFANNPTALALIETLTAYKEEEQEKLNPEEVLVVSLGTGSLTRSYPYERAKNWGLLGWIQPLINIALDGTSEVVSIQLNQLLNESHYYRFQGFLDQGKGNDEIDKVDSRNLEELESLALQIIESNSSRFDSLISKIM